MKQLRTFLPGLLLVATLLVSCEPAKKAAPDKPAALLAGKSALPPVDDPLRLLSYGAPPVPDWQNAQTVVGRRWGIEFYDVAGCVVTQPLIDSVAWQNGRVEKLIATKYGNNWRVTFDNEVKGERKKQKRATALLNNDPAVIALRARLQKNFKNHGLGFTFDSLAPNAYRALATGWGSTDNQPPYTVKLRCLVNLNAQTVVADPDSAGKD